MLREETLLGTIDKVQMAIERIKNTYDISVYQGRGALYVAFSGGKDSQCIAELAKMSGVPYELHFSPTTVDPPELLHFIRDNYPEVIWHKPKKSMWQLIAVKGMPPTKIVRYCCSEIKEGGGKDRVCITGVRKAESVRRSKREAYEINARKPEERMLFTDNEDRKEMDVCLIKQKIIVNPIIDWLDEDVWEFLYERDLRHCCLYDQGYKRIGCIGCPMANKAHRLQDFEKYPFFLKKYIMAFEEMLKENIRRGIPSQWKTGQDVFDWWINERSDFDKLKENGQTTFFDEE